MTTTMTKEEKLNKIKSVSQSQVYTMLFSGITMLLYSGWSIYEMIGLYNRDHSGGFSAADNAGFCLDSSRLFAGFFYAAALFIASSVFKGIMTSGTPFTEKIVKKFYVIAGLLITGAGISPVLGMGLTYLVDGKVNGRYDSASVYPIVVLGVAMAALGKIFSYGADLQQESDETL